MTAEASAYAVLGLEPGADAATIDRAYRDLIKRYHPDRAGGDADRAAEVNRAYLELRGPRRAGRELVLADVEPGEARRRSVPGSVPVGLFVALGGFLIILAPRWLGADARVSRSAGKASESRGVPSDVMDRPLTTHAIDESVREAVRMARNSDEMALARASRDCHRELRAEPSLERFDLCAAFDDAVVMLQDRDPLRNRGPFGELEVTGRQMGAASALSDDSLAIDSRLDRIRLHVELALVTRLPPPAVAPPVVDDVSG